LYIYTVTVSIIDVFGFSGYLLGAEQYYTHKRCFDIHEGRTHKRLCGLDLHENDKPVLNESGTYSTQLFTTRAEHVVKEHVKSGSNKASLCHKVNIE